MNRIILIRHAQSLANADPRLYKQLEGKSIGLSEEGHRQKYDAARKVLPLLRETPQRTTLWHGQSKRIIETKDGLLTHLAPYIHEVYPHSALREINLGLFYGATPEAEATTLKAVGDVYDAEKATNGPYHTPYPEGESPHDIQQNLSGFYEQVDASNSDTVIVISSGISLRVIAMHYCGLTPEEYALLSNPENASVQLLERGESGLFESCGYI